MLHRVATLIRKELQALLRDPQGRRMLIMPVILQLVLFPTAATLEVKNEVLAIYNQDAGKSSIELMQRFAQAQAFPVTLAVHSEVEMRQVIDLQKALMVVRFPQDFSRQIESGGAPVLQVILDGRRSNSAQVGLSYLQQIVQQYQRERRTPQIGVAGDSELVVRNWFNPNLESVWSVMPSLVAIITTVSALVVTAMSVAREREHGTFEQLLVSPLTPGMIMAGKAVPALLIAMVQGSIILSAGVFIYGVPFQGSLLLLYASMVCYILALVGFGLFISSICETQQQAFLGVFSFMMPAVLLSGFPAPIENMPDWLQRLTWFNPLRHFIVIVKGVFLKDVGIATVAANAWPLLVIGVITMAAADITFRRRIE